MRDLRRRALESHKTVSRKAASQVTSRASSRAPSQAASRQASDDEGNMSDSTAWSVNSIDDMLSADATEDVNEAWTQELRDRMEEIIDRKRSSVHGREATLAAYTHLLMSRYSYEEVTHKTSELFPALLKSVKAGSSEKEICLALRGLSSSSPDVVVNSNAISSYRPHNDHGSFRYCIRCHFYDTETHIHGRGRTSR